ncbi:MAG: Arm DNA-binding domain-containing protein, partial [Isosphaeraceae bacterium]
MIQRLCVDECVGATGNISVPMSIKAKKTANRLTALFVNSNKLEPGLYGDGNNLFLSVRQSGSRSWVFRFRQRGGNRVREMGLGTAGPDGVSLQDARDRAVALRADLRAGRDPIAEKKAAAAAPTATKKTFGDYALNDWLPVYAKGFKNPRSEKE